MNAVILLVVLGLVAFLVFRYLRGHWPLQIMDARLVISEYPVMDVYSAKRSVIQQEINEKIRGLLDKDGFLVDDVVLRDVHFTDQFAKAIEAKQMALHRSPEYIRYLYVDKLSDKISVIVADQPTIMDLKGLLEKK
jgi:hypothetical protein